MQIIYIIIYIGLLFSLVVLEKARFGAHLTPISFFSVVWCVVGIAANTGYYDYYLPSGFVNLLIILGVLIVAIFWGKAVKNPRIILQNITEPIDDFNFSSTVLIVLELVLFFIILPQFQQSLRILRTYTFAVLRGADIYGVSEDLGFSNQLISIFVRPGYTAISLMMVLSFFNKIDKSKKRLLFVFNIINLVVYTITTAGRIMIVNTIFYFILASIIYSRGRIGQYISKRKRIIIPIIILTIALLYVQKLRSPGASIIDTVYVYYCSGPIYLTNIMDLNKNVFEINKNFMLGSATFGFITNLISFVLIYFTGRPQGSSYMIGSVLTSYNVRVGEHTSINAMYTCFYNFLLDWGYAGIIIGPIVISVLAYHLYKKASINRSWTNMCLVIYFMNVLIRTVFKWELTGTEFSIVCLYLWGLKHFRFKLRNNSKAW